MLIRPMTIEDYENVYALWLSCPGMGLNDLDDSKAGIERFLCRNPDTCFVAEKGGALTGAIMAGSDGRRGYIYHTAVSPQYQGQGIGKRLVEKALSALQESGINKVSLHVFRRNEGGNAFWEKVGFTLRDDLYCRNKILVEMTRIET